MPIDIHINNRIHMHISIHMNTHVYEQLVTVHVY